MPAASKNAHHAVSSPDGKTISVAHAKANLSSVLTGVQMNKKAVTVLRRGVPIAQIVPIVEFQPVSGYGWMRGTVEENGDIVGPTGVEWTLGDE